MYQFFVGLLQPCPLLFVALATTLVLLWFRPDARRRLGLLTLFVLILTAVNLPIVGDLAVRSLEAPYPPNFDRPDNIEAIAVLCGYVRPPSDFWPEAKLGDDTLHRCLHAAQLYHQGQPCPVIVSGGKVPGTLGPSMAVTMKQFLLTQGVAEEDIILEDQALSGYENALCCSRLLAERGLSNVLLVTSAVHMPRAAGSFRKQRVDVIPAACDHLAAPSRPSLGSFWPNATAGVKFQTAAREWLGLVWYRLHGRL